MKNFIIQEAAYVSEPTKVHKTPLGTIRFIACLQEANAGNRNKRMYPKNVLEDGIHSTYIQERLRTKTLYGEAGHPLDPSLARQTMLKQDNLAVIIEKLWWEGNLLMALCETANTRIGKDMAGLIEQGSQVAFSLRAQGGVIKDPVTGLSVVKPGIQIITWDWVVNPSHDKAFMREICDDTNIAMFGDSAPVNEDEKKMQKYEMLFESGQMFEVEDDVKLEPINEDYTVGYNKRLREFNEIYFYDSNDQFIQESINNGKVDLQNKNVTKKVILEDYLLQDLRANICSLNEGIDERHNKEDK